jgi:hypothetical protein
MAGSGSARRPRSARGLHLTIIKFALGNAEWTQKGHHNTKLFLDKSLNHIASRCTRRGRRSESEVLQAVPPTPCKPYLARPGLCR